MKLTKQARKTARELYRACLENGVLNHASVRAVVDELLTRRPRGYLAVLVLFYRLVRLHELARTVTVESATDLTQECVARVRNALGQIAHGPIEFEYRTVPELIGGLRIRWGDMVLDCSIRARLEQLRRELVR